MENKLTPGQMVGGYSGFLAFVFVSTAIVWKWPDSGDWVLGGAMLLIAVFLFLVYRAARKATPPDLEK